MQSDIGRYTIVPEWVINQASPGALQLYITMGIHGDYESRESVLSLPKMAELCEVSESTVSRRLRELEDIGAVFTQKHGGTTRNPGPAVRVLRFSDPLVMADPPVTSDKGGSSPVTDPSIPTKNPSHKYEPSQVVAPKRKQPRKKDLTPAQAEVRAALDELFPIPDGATRGFIIGRQKSLSQGALELEQAGHSAEEVRRRFKQMLTQNWRYNKISSFVEGFHNLVPQKGQQKDTAMPVYSATNREIDKERGPIDHGAAPWER